MKQRYRSGCRPCRWGYWAREPTKSLRHTTSVVPSMTKSVMPGRASVSARRLLAGIRGASEECLQPGDPLLQGRRLDSYRLVLDLDRGGLVGKRPEPQRGPGVHDTAQPLVGATGVGELPLDLLALHLPAGA